jgi:hypothetical protein
VPANEVVYGGLRPGTAYQAEVKAIFNDTGLGKLSAKANVQTQLLDKGSFPLGVRLEVHSFKRELKATKPNQSFSNKKWNPFDCTHNRKNCSKWNYAAFFLEISSQSITLR